MRAIPYANGFDSKVGYCQPLGTAPATPPHVDHADRMDTLTPVCARTRPATALFDAPQQQRAKRHLMWGENSLHFPLFRILKEDGHDTMQNQACRRPQRRSCKCWLHCANSAFVDSKRGHALVLAIAILTAQTRITAAESDAWTTIIREGAEEYKESCAACHGTDAKGRGDLGQKLFKKPNDLTEIAKRNNGSFPFRRVFDVIAGDQPVDGHDTMHMPKYAERMKGEDFQPGYNRAHLRILKLAHYLESIQSAQQTPQR